MPRQLAPKLWAICLFCTKNRQIERPKPPEDCLENGNYTKEPCILPNLLKPGTVLDF